MSEFESLIPIDAVLEQQQKSKQALLILLDAQRDRRDHYLAIEARMGASRSYVTAVTLEWVSTRVRFATELPLFKEYVDPETKRVKLDRETAAIIQQREANWSRQFPMTLYLAKRRRHKFPPLLLVVTQPWVDDPRANEWDAKGRALRDSATVAALDSIGTYVDLHLTESDLLYAIDGQHRVMAIKGLSDLLAQGRIFEKNPIGKTLKKSVTIEDIVGGSKGDVSRADLQQLLAEKIGVEIIPAVMRGETRVEALRRVRSVFVHVNMTAVPLSKGEIALLNEDNGFAVVARMAMVNHPLLKDRTLLKKGNLTRSSEELTTLETLETISRTYLGQFPEFLGWFPDSRTEMATRPEEESLDAGYQALMTLFEKLAEIPSYKRAIDGKSVREIREEENNLLFRPLGQLALAEALGALVVEKHRKLDALITALAVKDTHGQFDITDPKAPWFGVVFEPNKKVMQRSESARTLCMRLLVHVLGGGTPDDQTYEKLKKDFQQARIVDFDANKAVDLKGHRVSPDKVELPSPWN